MNRIIPIVFSTDDNYVLPLAVAIKSLIDNRNKKDEYKIFVFHDELSEESKERIKSVCKGTFLEFVNVNSFLKGVDFYSVGHFTKAMYYRFFIPQVLSDYDKVLYLDCDILVKGDIGKLYDVDLGDNVIAGNRMFGDDNEYVNSGVLLFNVKEYLKNEICDRCVKYVAEHKDLKFPDEQTLNEVCKGKITKIGYEYNFQTLFCKSIETLETTGIKKVKDICVFHFTTKPWDSRDAHFGKLWWQSVNKMPRDLRFLIMEKYGAFKKQNSFMLYTYYFASPIGKIVYKIKKKLIKRK